MRSKRGVTLIETMVTMLIGAAVAAALFQAIGTLAFGFQAAVDSNNAAANNRKAIDMLADHVRNAQTCGNSSNGVLNAVLDSGTATSFTYYTDSNCTKVKYYLNGNSIVRVDGGVSTTLVTGVTSLTFSYYKAATYNSTWNKTTNPNAPTTSELPSVCGILIDAACSVNGSITHFTTTVRLRNAPVKGRLDGL